MQVLFRAHPIVSTFEWIARDKSLPYGPFQPAPDAVLDDVPHFECDPTLWRLWVEFHQKIRPFLTFPELDSLPVRVHLLHVGECLNRSFRLLGFQRRLIDHLGTTHVLTFPHRGDKWNFVTNYVSFEYANAAHDEVMHERMMWACMVQELAAYHPKLAQRRKEARDRCSVADMFWEAGAQIKNGLSRDFYIDVPMLSFPPPDIPLPTLSPSTSSFMSNVSPSTSSSPSPDDESSTQDSPKPDEPTIPIHHKGMFIHSPHLLTILILGTASNSRLRIRTASPDVWGHSQEYAAPDG
ncbi:hypothetical protein B0H16DRAFT_1712561 [Mycena metata]|uniref:Uncharacterized protein n=1 Tax=Mycena metata TaxID=1033252 RepID=A0AAD7K136_9AGAR|nr:hypothetical protein B0H16DRAFT_1712561 [Mycena metata]